MIKINFFLKNEKRRSKNFKKNSVEGKQKFRVMLGLLNRKFIRFYADLKLIINCFK